MWKWRHSGFKDVPIIGWFWDMHRQRLLRPAGYVMFPIATIGIPVAWYFALRQVAFQAAEGYRVLGAPPETVPWASRTGFVVALIPAAFLLAWLKRKRQSFYGYIELWAGLFTSVKAFDAGFSGNRESNLIILVGALYVLTRGASNMLDGLPDHQARQERKAEARRLAKEVRLTV